MTATLIIPFRDRGTDPLRRANLHAVRHHWESIARDFDWCLASDGRTGAEQFNRSAAYNSGMRFVSQSEPDVYVFAESDMIIGRKQIDTAIEIALHKPGLVIPFSHYRYLTEDASVCVRGGQDPRAFMPEFVMNNRRAIGAINVVSRKTMELIGGRWDEKFEGNWYDDDAMKIAFSFLAGETKFVHGPAYHLYHLPGWKGDHLTDEDRAATLRNKERLDLYRAALTRPDAEQTIRRLVKGHL